MNAPIPDWAYQAARTLRPTSTDSLDDIAKVIAGAHFRATQTTTCVYCGHEYPPGTPTSQADALTAHIKVCEKHPLGVVRRALVGLVGVDGAKELDEMEAMLRLMSAPEEDKTAMVNAVHALKSTL